MKKYGSTNANDRVAKKIARKMLEHALLGVLGADLDHSPRVVDRGLLHGRIKADVAP